MLLNTAYKTLLTPLERGLYLLELEGYPLHEGEISMSSEFLFEVMEINEELDEVDNIEDLQHVKDSNNLRMQNLLKFVLNFSVKSVPWILINHFILMVGKLDFRFSSKIGMQHGMC